MKTPPLALWTLGLACCGNALAQQIVLEPAATVLLGEPLAIRVTGLQAGAELQLRTQRVLTEFTGEQRHYVATARFRAGIDGTLDLATAEPLPGGSYTGADLRGLFWSMQPLTAETRAVSAAGHAPGLKEGQVRIDVLPAGGAADAAPRATRTLTLQRALPQVQTEPVSAFPGAVYSRLPGSATRPALIVLGGSEGGATVTRDAPVYASRGYAVLALPYYSPARWGASGPQPPELPELPRAFADLPIERLEAARDWLARQPGVDAQRIGVLGTSKGAEFALLAAVRMPWIRSVVAIVPSDVVWEGWGEGVAPGTRSGFAWKGQALPFVPYKGFAEEFAGFATGADVKIRRPQDAGRAAHPERVPPARIPVEAIAAPVMVVGGHDDQVWDSGGMAEAIHKSRAAAGRETLALVYRDAGHFLGGTGWGPTTQYNDGPSKSGGTPVANAHAQAEAFTQSLRFLQRTLGPLPPP
jgi:dienelactone hydrolase